VDAAGASPAAPACRRGRRLRERTSETASASHRPRALAGGDRKDPGPGAASRTSLRERQSAILRSARQALLRSRGFRGLCRARHRLLVRARLSCRFDVERRAVRHVRHDGRAQDAAAAVLRPSDQPQERQEWRCARQRSRPVQGGPHHRSFLHGGRQARHAEGRHDLRGGAGFDAGGEPERCAGRGDIGHLRASRRLQQRSECRDPIGTFARPRRPKRICTKRQRRGTHAVSCPRRPAAERRRVRSHRLEVEVAGRHRRAARLGLTTHSVNPPLQIECGALFSPVRDMIARILPFALLSFALLAGGCSDSSPTVEADIGSQLPPPILGVTANTSIKPPPIPAPPQVPAKGYYLIDYRTNQVLAAHNENERLEPASLTKLMTGYAVFHALRDGRIRLDDMVRISAYARSQEGSRMFVEAGSMVSVENLIRGMIVQSGNDATVALAEHVAGSEPVFVDLMNQYAQQLGMTSTHFQNSPGMPGPEHYTTARDVAILASALIRDYPDYYKYYSEREFTWNKITQPNRNGLLYRDPSVDGLKTGHTESAGYCLVSSAERDGRRLVSVVIGAPSVRARERSEEH